MRRSSLIGFIALLVSALGVAGCGVNFYFGRPSDVKRIGELSSEIDRIKAQKDVEADQLKEAQRMLEERLQQEISDKQVHLDMAERGLVLTFVSEVLFDSGKATLRSEAKETLRKVASVIKEKVSDRDVGIEGHTDNQPIKHSGWRSNWELSTSRATAVLHALEDAGVNPHRLVAIGYGEYHPVDSNDTSDGRRKNRRVEIVILPKRLTKAQKDVIRRAARSQEPSLADKAKALEEYK